MSATQQSSTVLHVTPGFSVSIDDKLSSLEKQRAQSLMDRLISNICSINERHYFDFYASFGKNGSDEREVLKINPQKEEIYSIDFYKGGSARPIVNGISFKESEEGMSIELDGHNYHISSKPKGKQQ